MKNARRIYVVGLGLLACGWATAPAFSQQDVQITSQDISRACADIHHTPNVDVDPPTVRGERDIVLNCRLVAAGGVTIAQVSPAEVCQRMTGSSEWYRGMGTQVYCTAGGTAPPAPRSFTITEDDIAKACQRTHHNPQATADPTTVGPYGLELNCRLVNGNGVTLARVSPEDVCYSKFGTREWIGIAGSRSFLCQATPIDVAEPQEFPNKPPGGGGGSGGGGGGGGASSEEAFNDVPLTPEAMIRGCRVLYGDVSAATMTYAGASGLASVPIINCTTSHGVLSHSAAEVCPKLSGTPDWYLTDFGRGTWMPGEAPGAAPRVQVCRGRGPLQYHALADIGRYCKDKGYRYASYGIAAQKPPACFSLPGVPVTISMGDVCREVHRANAHERRGLAIFCLPERVASASRRP